ncbi:gamma-glutamyl-gamma-aminobutyrate hydrolase family protein [Elioraea rosea]|uniref:gamma-glutamyl-gamma-aminobutyrate hydrolase family protein n=1 Tax=Elioraea rosea TaxID=2492390 RepID=UPI0011846998|nr:gamma-glutamyl-gamma-aminobutyrate hydrolase family protein [Elioraea rosea]
MKPLIGISCCVKLFGSYGRPNHAVSDTYVRAVDLVIGGLPCLIPAMGERADVESFLGRIDGLILTGSPSNVLPSLYGGPPHPDGVPEDPARDAVTLPLIRAAIGLGVPMLAICRGMQELNVALGGTLDQRIQDLPGRMDHSTPTEQAFGPVRTAKAHEVRLAAGARLAAIVGGDRLSVNSLHNQGIARLAPGLVVEATAPDGTIEAVRVSGARGFALGVQWHPEYDFETDSASRAIFMAFADAVARYTGARGRDGASRIAAE